MKGFMKRLAFNMPRILFSAVFGVVIMEFWKRSPDYAVGFIGMIVFMIYLGQPPDDE